MSQLHLVQLENVEQLLQRRADWDALWHRSEVTIPTARAELVALWLERFAADEAFRGLMIYQGDWPLAAIPLVGRRIKGIVPAGDVTWNYWSPNGDLLVDPQCNRVAVMDRLVTAVGDLPWPMLWLEMPPLQTPRWRAWIDAFARRGLPCEMHHRYRIGTVRVPTRWDELEAGLSRSLRRSLGKEQRRLERTGPVVLKTYTRLSPERIERHLQQAFEIEDRGWKGEAASSVLRAPSMLEFYAEQARILARWESLRLSFLEHRGQPIAFELGWSAKGVYHSFKVGYDPAFARYSPGNLLRMSLLRALCDEGGHHTVDFQGPLSGALASWSTGSYPIGRIVCSTGGRNGGMLVGGYRAIGAALRVVRDWTTPGRPGDSPG